MEIINKHLEKTNLLDYDHPLIQNLISTRKWENLDEKNKILQIYLFVRDEILFGYNTKDDLRASDILGDKYGQCNTKSTLLMALFRAVGIPCRLHGFTIDKKLQKGAISGIWYFLAPKNIIHTWVEVEYKKKWYNLEGVILDQKYLQSIQKKYKNHSNNFCGYGIYTEKLQSPEIEWDENNTYIQSLGINNDFGIFDTPDDFYKIHFQDLSFIKRIIYETIVRKIINKNVEKIREE